VVVEVVTRDYIVLSLFGQLHFACGEYDLGGDKPEAGLHSVLYKLGNISEPTG
jgi:hypothetical protein